MSDRASKESQVARKIADLAELDREEPLSLAEELDLRVTREEALLKRRRRCFWESDMNTDHSGHCQFPDRGGDRMSVRQGSGGGAARAWAGCTGLRRD